jgi:hypothetical protein
MSPPSKVELNSPIVAVMSFVALRAVLLIALPLEAWFQYGDFQHYYNIASWSVSGHCPISPSACWPLIDYWYEFPPIFPYLSIALLKLGSGGELLPFHSYAYRLAFFLLAIDVANLWLFWRIAGRLQPPPIAQQLLWVYALSPAPIVLSGWTFDGLTTFWMSLALWALLEKRDGVSALALGLGAMTKLVPVLLLPVVWRTRSLKRSAAITAGVAAVCLITLAPFLWRAPSVAVASLAAQASKSSYATVWAMLDGNLQTPDGQPITGNFGPNLDHFELSRATTPIHNPSRLPGWLPIILFGAVYLWVWGRRWKSGLLSEREAVTLFGFTWAIFVLWSKGWSPQWQQMLLPLILLTFPNLRGVLLALVLAFVSFLEWPVLLSRGMVWGYWITIPLRTLVFAIWALELASRLLKSQALLKPGSDGGSSASIPNAIKNTNKPM